MKHLRSILMILFFIAAFGLPGAVAADGPAFVFASVDEGKAMLMKSDDFIERLSPADRAIRMKSERPVSTADFLDFVGKNVTPWDGSEKERLTTIVNSLKPRIAPFSPFLPNRIFLIKTTGDEEANAAYTRGEAIVIPARLSQTMDMVSLYKLISHELFHVMTRRDKTLAEEMYSVIGFTRCPPFTLPRNLESRRITNPDAPHNDHCITVSAGGKKLRVVPILYSNMAVYNTRHGETLFDYLEVAFLAVGQDRGKGKEPAPLPEKDMKLFKENELKGFVEQIGRNTDYTIHPEEILADNFTFLLLGRTQMASPQIVAGMKKVFAKKTKK